MVSRLCLVSSSSAGARPTEAPQKKLHVGPPLSASKIEVKMVLHRMQFSSDVAFHAYSCDF